jgi:hypothetical protein
MERSALQKPTLKQRLLQAASDVDEILRAYEHLAIRIFIFVMAVYGLIQAAKH